jgi:hypothetical protein
VHEVVSNFCDITWLQFRGFAIHNKTVLLHKVSINITTSTTDEYASLNICSSVLRLDADVQLLITWNMNLSEWYS